MEKRSSTASLAEEPKQDLADANAELFALVMIWAADEPHRIGEIAFLGPPAGRLGEVWLLGRGDDGEPNRLRLVRQRPGLIEPTGPIESRAVSVKQAVVRRTKVGFLVERVGKRRIFVNGAECESGFLAPGDTLLVEGQLLFLCVLRRPKMPSLRYFPAAMAGAFGEMNQLGMVGEGPAFWDLCERMAMVAMAKPPNHALITGETGTGKERVAGGIHALSDRKSKPFVARSAAALSPGVVEVLLFGNRKDWPNPGMPETLGIVLEAEGGILFLDEIGEAPQEMHAKLLRFLDQGGEFHRGGEKGIRRANVRFICATNRRREELKHDFFARLTLEIEVPSLEQRREDISLLVRHLLLELARENPDIAGRFVDVVRGRQEPRLDAFFADDLVRRKHPLNVRGLRQTLWKTIIEDKHGNVLCATERMRHELAAQAKPAPAAPVAGMPRSDGLTKERILAALEKNKWRLAPTASELGLRDRHAVSRVMKRLGIAGRQG